MNLLRLPLRSALHRPCLIPRQQPLQAPQFLAGHRAYASIQKSRGGKGGSNRRGAGRRREEQKDEREYEEVEIIKTKPTSPSFYTGRAGYYDQVIQIQTAISHVRKALQTLQLLPLPQFARDSLPPLRPVWKPQDEMSADFQCTLTTSRYRRVTALLNELNDYNRIAHAANAADLANGIQEVISMFESGKKGTYVAQAKRKQTVLDNYGRSYTVGKRKTSSARVWMIPVNDPSETSTHSPDTIEGMFGLEGTTPKNSPVTMATILVNNVPLAEYFPIPADRERITRPFKVAGVLGAYNVFALVRGGGTSGQSGALAHGIAKALVAHEPKLDLVLRRAKLLRRDPRMVERKKTGLAKARKRYTWVKR